MTDSTTAAVVVAVLAACALLGGIANIYENRHARRARRAVRSYWEPLGAAEPVHLVIDPLTAGELKLAALDHGAESFAANPRLFEESTDDVARQIWHAGFDQAIAEVNRRFEELTRDLPTSDDEPLPPGYWPVVSAVPMSCPPVTLDRLATFAPEATLAIVEERNAARPVFSWSTGSYSLVPAPSAVRNDVPRHRQRAGRHSGRR